MSSTDLTPEQLSFLDEKLKKLRAPEVVAPAPRAGSLLLDPVTIPTREAGMSDTVTRIRSLWTIIETVVDELIQSAEVVFGAGKGDQKRAYVKAKALEFLKKLEGQKDFLPPALEGVVFLALDFALDYIIERVFVQLVAAKKVNVSA